MCFSATFREHRRCQIVRSPVTRRKGIRVRFRTFARMGSESIAREAEGRMGYLLRDHEGERNNIETKQL